VSLSIGRGPSLTAILYDSVAVESSTSPIPGDDSKDRDDRDDKAQGQLYILCLKMKSAVKSKNKNVINLTRLLQIS